MELAVVLVPVPMLVRVLAVLVLVVFSIWYWYSLSSVGILYLVLVLVVWLDQVHYNVWSWSLAWPWVPLHSAPRRGRPGVPGAQLKACHVVCEDARHLHLIRDVKEKGRGAEK